MVLTVVAACLPLGLDEFLAANWMKGGALLAPLIVVFSCARRRRANDPFLVDVETMSCLLLAAYMAHQVEEHWIDLLGRRYALHDILNSLVASALGEDRYGIVTRGAIFRINTGMVWTAGFLAILLSRRRIFPSIALAGLIFVNGLSHVVQALATQAYNPGLATSLVFFLPLSLAYGTSTLRAGALSPRMAALGVLWGVFAHLILFGGLIAANVLALFPVAVYHGSLVLWGLLPGLASRHSA
ncbi:MAG: HXXEE domain-containing protein [Myxococcota bacterium]